MVAVLAGEGRRLRRAEAVGGRGAEGLVAGERVGGRMAGGSCKEPRCAKVVPVERRRALVQRAVLRAGGMAPIRGAALPVHLRQRLRPMSAGEELAACTDQAGPASMYIRRHGQQAKRRIFLGQRGVSVKQLPHFPQQRLVHERLLQEDDAGVEGAVLADDVVGAAGDEDDPHPGAERGHARRGRGVYTPRRSHRSRRPRRVGRGGRLLFRCGSIAWETVQIKRRGNAGKGRNDGKGGEAGTGNACRNDYR